VAKLKVFRSGKEFGVGLFEKFGGMLKGTQHPYFKTKRGAEKYIIRIKKR